MAIKLQAHPFLKDIAMMPSHEIDALADDIKKNGQRIPIVLYGGKILDGRNRYEACKRAGVEPRVVQFTKSNPRDYVTSINYFRKHWTTSERAHFAALMSLESDRGNPDTPLIAPNGAITQSEAAKQMGVSRRSVQRAKIKIQGKPESQSKKPDNGEVVDENGTLIPAPAMTYWNRKPEAKNVLAQISAARGQVKKLLPDDPMWSSVNLNGVLADLNNAFNRFAAAVPSYVCPYCKGEKPDKCKCCKGKGVVSKFVWSTIPEEHRCASNVAHQPPRELEKGNL